MLFIVICYTVDFNLFFFLLQCYFITNHPALTRATLSLTRFAIAILVMDPTGLDPNQPDRTQRPNPMTQPNWTQLDLTGLDDPTQPNPRTQPNPTRQAWYCEPVEGQKE
jgi:hypothetical protein